MPVTPGDRAGAAQDMRCHCGNLLARVVAGGVELKCRRCRRRMLIEIVTTSPAGTPARVRPVTGAGGDEGSTDR